MRFEAIVIGASWGGVKALSELLQGLPKDLAIPIFIVQHLSSKSDSYLATFLQNYNGRIVKEAEAWEVIDSHTTYVAPPNYHMLIDPSRAVLLSVEEKVNFSRPSIDVLFQSSAEVYREHLIGIVLTGANSDGTKGLARIKALGGVTIAQNPVEAEADAMPRAAILSGAVDYIVRLEEIGIVINTLIGDR